MADKIGIYRRNREEKRADVVFVIDASNSMDKCFASLKTHLKTFAKTFVDEGFDSLRLGFLAYGALPSHKGDKRVCYRHVFLTGDKGENMSVLYDESNDAKDNFFTNGNIATGVDTFCRQLGKVETKGDENTPLALDTAADFPFGPICTTRRTIVLFTDEKMKHGLWERDGKLCRTFGDPERELLKKTLDKIKARHIQLFYVGPDGEDALIRGTPRMVARKVKDYWEAKKEGVSVKYPWDDETTFKELMTKISNRVSGSTLQGKQMTEGDYTPATYGQRDPLRFDPDEYKEASKHLQRGEIRPIGPLEWVNARLYWETAIDLDLHAFVEYVDGDTFHIYFQSKRYRDVELDRDSGIGNTFDFTVPVEHNEENIKCSNAKIIKRLLFATKIYPERGTFNEYKACVEISSNNQSKEDGLKTPEFYFDIKSDQRLDWCVIGMVDNSDPALPFVERIDQVVRDDPGRGGLGPDWEHWKRFAQDHDHGGENEGW